VGDGELWQHDRLAPVALEEVADCLAPLPAVAAAVGEVGVEVEVEEAGVGAGGRIGEEEEEGVVVADVAHP
jgi:hypothetical protein